MMYKILPVLAVLAAAYAAAQPQNNQPQTTGGGDLDSIISDIFGPGPGSQPDSSTVPAPAEDKNTILLPTNQGPSTIVPPGISDITNDTSCTTEKGAVGECVRYYLCDANNEVITDGTSIIDIRVRDGPCPSYLDTCCILKDKRDPNNPILPTPSPIPDNNGNNNGNNQNGNNNNNDNSNNNNVKNQGCGWRNPEGVVMRTTGDVDGEAKFGEFPWMVAILKIEPVNANDPNGQKLNVYVGGGSLIHYSVVLTAAHYVAEAKELRVRSGEWDTQTVKEIYPYQDRDVAKIEIHKDFNRGNLFYDVALLFLSKPVDLAPNVGLACLPPPVKQTDPPAPGTRCFASGWGKDKFGKEGRYQVILKKVTVPIVDRRDCEAALQKTRLGVHFKLHTSFMCAGGEKGKDTCKGDGGSPLVCPIQYEEGRFVQSGIVAWGIGCGEDGTPGVYVDVSRVREWIDDKVKGQGYSINDYSYTF